MTDRNEVPKDVPLQEPTPIADIDDIVLDEHRRSPQFIFVQEQVKKLPPPGKVQTDLFNWKYGHFRGTGSPLVVRIGVQLLVALLLCSSVIVVEFTDWIPDGYTLFSRSTPVKLDFVVETLRFFFLVGVAFLFYVVSQSVICLIPWLTYRACKQQNTEPNEILRSKIEQLLSIRYYVGYAVFGLVIALMSRILYPYNAEAIMDESATKAFVKVLKETAQDVKAKAAEAGQDEKSASDNAAAANEIIKMAKNLKSFTRQPFQYFVASGCLAIGLVTAVLLVEKILVRLVSHRYHSHGLALRINVNRFARKVTKQLREYFLQRDPSLHNKQWDAGVLIYNCIGKETISQEDFYDYMSETEASRYFSILDPDLQGSLGKDQFLAAIDGLYLEQSAIDRAFNDQNRIIERFDRLLMSAVWIISVFITVICLNPPIRFLITICAGVIGSTAFMFQDTIKSVFKSIVFILFTHPFDADDWIIIDDALYNVHELGLWTSTYKCQSGQVVYISNLSLVNKPIINLRRSPIMNEFIQISIMPTTTRAQIQNLEATLLQWLKEHQRDYVPTLFIRSVKMTDKEHLTLEMNLAHRSNFNDQIKKDFRSRKFMFRVKECLEELNIELSPPLRP